MELPIPAEHLLELRVRQSMIEHEASVLEALVKMLRHEEEITRQIEAMLAFLVSQEMHVTHKEDYDTRRITLRRQYHETQKLQDRIDFLSGRATALGEALSFYLVEHFAIDPSLSWHLDLENECLKTV